MGSKTALTKLILLAVTLLYVQQHCGATGAEHPSEGRKKNPPMYSSPSPHPTPSPRPSPSPSPKPSPKPTMDHKCPVCPVCPSPTSSPTPSPTPSPSPSPKPSPMLSPTVCTPPTAITVPVRQPLPPIPSITIPPNGNLVLTLVAAEITIADTFEPGLQARWTGPVYFAHGLCEPTIQPPTLILPSCSKFSITLWNQLPFQPFHTCPAAYNATEVDNGPKDTEWTNLHTHGLKIDPGAIALENFCDAPPGASFTPEQFYCDPNLGPTPTCPVLGDNVYVATDGSRNPRPMMPSQRAGGSAKYTYPMPTAMVPGVGWYHGHVHGSVGSQGPTAAGPLVTPESSLPKGVRQLYLCLPGTEVECENFIQFLEKNPLEKSLILQFNGIWFRKIGPNNTDPDDDTIPFIGAAANPPSALLYSNASTSEPLFINNAGRDYVTVNGGFQPTIKITDSTLVRWQLLSTMSLKWLDLTVRYANDTTRLVDDCKFWLIEKDGIPLPEVPRLIKSTSANISNVVLGNGARADVAFKCNTPGTYLLVSGAGPFHTNPAVCKATHCELFGDPPANDATLYSANSFFNGVELPDADAVLAVIQVNEREDGEADMDLPAEPVCRSRLEQFYYLNYQSFPSNATEQCFSFMNQMNGGFCSINSCLFREFSSCVKQGTTQRWHLRDTSAHPWHLHETPTRIIDLPPCVTRATNYWMVGDWHDLIHIPVCQFGCSWNEGIPGDSVSVCDQVTVEWLAVDFSDPTRFVNHVDNCFPPGYFPPPTPCVDRFAVAHCHILPHEDEGCMMPVQWTCGDCGPIGVCPETYGYSEAIPAADRCNLINPMLPAGGAAFITR